MAIVSVKIPQLGEGLQEARLLGFLKKPGDYVSKDEPIYEIETDKAVTNIESPYEGKLVSWTVEVDAVLAIGTEIGSMEVADAAELFDDHSASAVEPIDKPVPTATATSLSEQTIASSAGIPPRTLGLLREKGLMHLVDQIPAAGKRLQPADVEAFIAAGGQASWENTVGKTPSAAKSKPVSSNGNASNDGYVERPLNSAQRTLNFRMARGVQVVLPAVLETDIDWTAIQVCRERVRKSGGPSGFAMLSWCIARAMQQHPLFRCTLSADGNTLRTYDYANLGIAVSVADDVLLTAVVRNADALSKRQFFESLSKQIQAARDGQDQVDATTTVTVSNIGIAGMRTGIPVVVTPAVATIALGAVRDEPVPNRSGFSFKKMVSLTMSFDHRVVNGIGAAKFLNTIRSMATKFTLDDVDDTGISQIA